MVTSEAASAWGVKAWKTGALLFQQRAEPFILCLVGQSSDFSISLYLTVAYFPSAKSFVNFLLQKGDIHKSIPQIITTSPLGLATNSITWLKTGNIRCWRCARSIIQTFQTFSAAETPHLAETLHLLGEGRWISTLHHSSCYTGWTSLHGSWKTAVPSASLFLALFPATASCCQVWGRTRFSWGNG